MLYSDDFELLFLTMVKYKTWTYHLINFKFSGVKYIYIEVL
jgi:hypothetical protein